jgi:hypothetical protein
MLDKNFAMLDVKDEDISSDEEEEVEIKQESSVKEELSNTTINKEIKYEEVKEE